MRAAFQIQDAAVARGSFAPGFAWAISSSESQGSVEREFPSAPVRHPWTRRVKRRVPEPSLDSSVEIPSPALDWEALEDDPVFAAHDIIKRMRFEPEWDTDTDDDVCGYDSAGHPLFELPGTEVSE